MKTDIGRIKEKRFRNGECYWDVTASRYGQLMYKRFDTEEEAVEYLHALRDAAKRKDTTFIEEMQREYEAARTSRQNKASKDIASGPNGKYPNHRAPLEFTHKLLLPMSVSYDKMVELVRRLGNADRSQVICATRHITKPPHRVLLFGLRVPRLGSNYVFSVVRGLLGYNVTAEIMRIGERPRVRQSNHTNVTEEEDAALESICGNTHRLSRRLSVLFDKNEQRIRAWHAQGFAVREIVARLFPHHVKSSLTPHTKEIQHHFSHSLCFYKGRSSVRVEVLKRWEDIQRWEKEGHSCNWMSSKLGINGSTFRMQLELIKGNQAANARLQSTTHSDE